MNFHKGQKWGKRAGNAHRNKTLSLSSLNNPTTLGFQSKMFTSPDVSETTEHEDGGHRRRHEGSNLQPLHKPQQHLYRPPPASQHLGLNSHDYILTKFWVRQDEDCVLQYTWTGVQTLLLMFSARNLSKTVLSTCKCDQVKMTHAPIYRPRIARFFCLLNDQSR